LIRASSQRTSFITEDKTSKTARRGGGFRERATRVRPAAASGRAGERASERASERAWAALAMSGKRRGPACGSGGSRFLLENCPSNALCDPGGTERGRGGARLPARQQAVCSAAWRRRGALDADGRRARARVPAHECLLPRAAQRDRPEFVGSPYDGARCREEDPELRCPAHVVLEDNTVRQCGSRGCWKHNRHFCEACHEETCSKCTPGGYRCCEKCAKSFLRQV
jgi:hypothetical protein